jgi:hypothetical protein
VVVVVAVMVHALVRAAVVVVVVVLIVGQEAQEIHQPQIHHKGTKGEVLLVLAVVELAVVGQDFREPILIRPESPVRAEMA